MFYCVQQWFGYGGGYQCYDYQYGEQLVVKEVQFVVQVEYDQFYQFVGVYQCVELLGFVIVYVCVVCCVLCVDQFVQGGYCDYYQVQQQIVGLQCVGVYVQVGYGEEQWQQQGDCEWFDLGGYGVLQCGIVGYCYIGGECIEQCVDVEYFSDQCVVQCY